MADVLIVSPLPTVPIFAGNRARLYSLLSEIMAAGHRVHFLYLDRFQQANLTQMAELYESFHVVPYSKKGFLQFLALQVYKLTRGNPNWMGFIDHLVAKCLPKTSHSPMGIDDWYNEKIDTTIKDLQRHCHFDAVIVEYVYLSKALDLFPKGTLKIIDTHDVFTDRHKLYLKNNMNPVAFFTAQEEEKKGLDRAHVILAIQDEDAQYFKQITSKKVLIVGYKPRINQKNKRVNSTTDTAEYILYVGSNNVANQHAIEFFFNKIWNPLYRKRKDIRIVIAGTICHYVTEKFGTDGVNLKYHVEDLSTIYNEDCIVINPVFIGTGLKIKNIEALYYRRPLITTSVGAQGLRRWSHRSFLVADTAESMSSAIKELYYNGEARESLIKSATHFINDYNRIYDYNINHLLSLIKSHS